MNYELAKQLKDAGFPQEPKDKFIGYNNEFTGGKYVLIGKGIGEGGETYLMKREHREFKERGDTLTKIPSLSELIEAIPSFLNLFQQLNDEAIGAGQWQAQAQLTEITHGKTPEEAVAKLYIKLNDKNRRDT